MEAEEPWVLPHHRNDDQECIFEGHDVDDAVHELEEASGIAELVVLTLVLERLAPDDKDAHQLSHLLLVLLHLVLSAQLELLLVVVSGWQWLLELTVICACLFVVAGRELEVQDVLVNLPECVAVVFQRNVEIVVEEALLADQLLREFVGVLDYDTLLLFLVDLGAKQLAPDERSQDARDATLD